MIMTVFSKSIKRRLQVVPINNDYLPEHAIAGNGEQLSVF